MDLPAIPDGANVARDARARLAYWLWLLMQREAKRRLTDFRSVIFLPPGHTLVTLDGENREKPV